MKIKRLVQQRKQARKLLVVKRQLVRRCGKKACALVPEGDAHLQIDMDEVWHAGAGSIPGYPAVK